VLGVVVIVVLGVVVIVVLGVVVFVVVGEPEPLEDVLGGGALLDPPPLQPANIAVNKVDITKTFWVFIFISIN
jgi:hypothetical protein